MQQLFTQLRSILGMICNAEVSIHMSVNVLEAQHSKWNAIASSANDCPAKIVGVSLAVSLLLFRNMSSRSNSRCSDVLESKSKCCLAEVVMATLDKVLGTQVMLLLLQLMT